MLFSSHSFELDLLGFFIIFLGFSSAKIFFIIYFCIFSTKVERERELLFFLFWRGVKNSE
uniref:Uncharacterized protein n=1 Tax=Rhizophora mucronata TaxID=61149 RepID=A0A2P2QTC3_RHIMU